MKRLTPLKRLVNATAVTAVLLVGAAPAANAVAAAPGSPKTSAPKTSSAAADSRHGKHICPPIGHCRDTSWGG
ncbi:hypothetical protein [Saccharothrix sp. ST-888]|uniref:hypothetical protein n=1 Tax=Saccharothrix sp. ST-888 TaxID=1427391 RepID=UPI0005ECD0F6|nr:hypothetical protein [Saccharothrix sp. ST-888]KJK57855.1 hypothetical protein UK12_13730 [Saccharothrix sp. ST-888]